MTDIIREAERIIAVDESRKEYLKRTAKYSAESSGAWFKLHSEVPEMIACIRGLYSYIAERYGIEVNPNKGEQDENT